jgi:ferredoxin
MARRVVIDADECIGCESCVELCAEVFAFNEAEEKAEVIMPEGGPEETCPTECISWEGDE